MLGFETCSHDKNLFLRSDFNYEELGNCFFAVGDVDYESVRKVAGFITPVPGGTCDLVSLS